MNIATEKSHRINHEISTPEVRLTGVEGEAFGIVKLSDALHLAEERDVDLVKIAPAAQPFVCRLMDYDKFRCQGQKKAHDAKLKQKVIQVKEVKFRPGIGDNDYGVKLCNTTRFLEDGGRVKVTLRLRDHEMAHQELGMRVLGHVEPDLKKFGQVERVSKTKGRQVVMTLASKKKK